MAVAIIHVLLFAVIGGSNCEPPHGYNNGRNFGELLKPPPLPNIVPVPFHGGAGRLQRQNVDFGYQYQPPPPPPPPPIPSSSNFKFPSPFFKQYNFNFVPPPQPFTTTPSPSVFQKVSGWLFPSPQTSYDANSQTVTNLAPIKKECNPCNQMPWIPVIRYDLTGKKLNHNVQPTYGAPSPTANLYNAMQYSAQPFHRPQDEQQLQQLSGGIPHQTYGPPNQQQNIPSFSGPSSTYGPPSATHVVDTASPSPPSSTYGVPSSSFTIPSSSYGVPSSSYSIPSTSYGVPSSSFGVSSSSNGIVSSSFIPSNGVYSSTFNSQSPSFGVSSSSHSVSSPGSPNSISTYGTPSPSYGPPGFSNPNVGTVTPSYDDNVPNYQPPQANDVDDFRLTAPDSEQKLPKVTHPTGFKNSYGEPISGSHLGIPYPVSAAEGSSKIKTELLPNGQKPSGQNSSFALSKPAPFSLNRGRNIHTLQPVALPNLSISPLPPIFNARPFRTVTSPSHLPEHSNQINNLRDTSSKVSISPSIAVAEFSQAEYPATFIQSPLIDLTDNSNQTKAYRHIPNSYIIDQHRDISSQASEDTIQNTASTRTKTKIQDHSFESTGSDVINDLYDMPPDLKKRVPPNHRENFADLRGVTDDDVDKYRTEPNLQSIDSPLLYLKPSAPHKEYEHFLLALSTPGTGRDYELYDDGPTTISPQFASYPNTPNKIKTDLGEGFSTPLAQEDSNKPKIVQIIIPYTTSDREKPNEDYGQTGNEWVSASEDGYQARKVPTNTENYYNSNTATDNYITEGETTTENPTINNDYYDSDKFSTQAILNDLYDVKEPPFDIIKLQQNIDDWTEQQFSHHPRTTQKSRINSKFPHAKQIPDEYFTTMNPITSYVTINNYDFYDHEGSDSMQHSVTESTINITSSTPRVREYNTIIRNNEKHKYENTKLATDSNKPHIYTAASSFRSTSTTPAPWGKIETSISPLTKEKVYVVTSKPWRETPNVTDWQYIEEFESKKTKSLDNDVSSSDNLPFKSPRFLSRPSFGATSSGETLKSDASYGFSLNWHQSINELEAQQEARSPTTPSPEGSNKNVTTNEDEVTIGTTTAGHQNDDEK